jgi:hypothetical protein
VGQNKGRGGGEKKKKKEERYEADIVTIDAVMVRGNTFPLRSDLKDYGFHWDAEAREWWRRSEGFSDDSVRWLRSFSRVGVEFGVRLVRRSEVGGLASPRLPKQPKPSSPKQPTPPTPPSPPSPMLRWGEAIEELNSRLPPEEIVAIRRLIRHGGASFQFLEHELDQGAVRIRFGSFVLTRYKTGETLIQGRDVRGPASTTLVEGVERIVQSKLQRVRGGEGRKRGRRGRKRKNTTEITRSSA